MTQISPKHAISSEKFFFFSGEGTSPLSKPLSGDPTPLLKPSHLQIRHASPMQNSGLCTPKRSNNIPTRSHSLKIYPVPFPCEGIPVLVGIAGGHESRGNSCELLTHLLKDSIEPGVERVQALADISRSALHAFAVYEAISLHRPT